MILNNYFWTDESIERNKITEKYEICQSAVFFMFLRDFSCEYVLDIGANIGYYSLLSALDCGVKKIYSFEAIDDTYEALIENIKLNKMENRVSAYNIGVSDSIKEVSFLVQSKSFSGINCCETTTFHNANLFENKKKVKCISMDQFEPINLFSEKKIMIKIDVEGHEIYALNGMLNLLRNNYCLIQIECYHDNKKAVVDFFQNINYVNIFTIDNDLYFTNYKLYYDDGVVKKIVSASLKLIVDNNLEKFPTALKSHLDCNIEIESNVLHVNVNSDKLKHIMDLSKTEYAFYLLINGKICQKFPYIECSKFSINLKEYQDKISGNNLAVRVFVREKNNYAKKLNKVFRIKS
ncbi:FkbM family methyltransferase [Helicobacter pullorum]|uniref:FkbM family methyltransferase n=1 Tax=Helicobacter pullorum TaxID=35818 RepID=UPI001E08BBDF|nr:FkbM family methyltransferase [Helicobacter pullorum]HJF83834.1 FkbM family methyltransferase [Helicobacter pullorum]